MRNRLKVASAVGNAKAFLATRAEYGSFADYLWAWVDGKPIVNRPRTMADLPARTELSDRLGKDLKKRGFNFVGSTIVYSYLQAVGRGQRPRSSTCPLGVRSVPWMLDLGPSGRRSSTWGWRPVRIGLSGESTISVRRTSAFIATSRARHARELRSRPRPARTRPTPPTTAAPRCTIASESLIIATR